MKNLLPLVFFILSSHSSAQTHTSMPAEAYSFYKEAMVAVKPPIKKLIEKKAHNLKDKKVETDSLIQVLGRDSLLKNTNQREIEAIVVLIMVQISRNADADLKDLVVAMHKNGETPTQQTDEGKNESEIRVESILAAKSRIARNVSLVMKRIGGSQEIVIDNLR